MIETIIIPGTAPSPTVCTYGCQRAIAAGERIFHHHTTGNPEPHDRLVACLACQAVLDYGPDILRLLES